MDTRRVRAVLAVAVAAVILVGCAGLQLPSRQPDAVGTVGDVGSSGDEVILSFVPDVGFEYFQGTLFLLDDTVDVVGADGNAIAASDIGIGARIEVWTDACAESFPVQCDVTDVRIVEP